MLLVQGLLFADGGITALGTNITLMALVGVGGRLAGLRASCDGAARRGSGSVAPAAAIAAFVTVPVAAVGRSSASSRSAATRRSTSARSLTAMVGWHLVIGIGEAVITGLVVAQRRSPPAPTSSTAPARLLAERELEIRDAVVASMKHAHASSPSASCSSPAARRRRQLLRQQPTPTGSSTSPEQTGFVDAAEDSAAADSPLADYPTKGVDDARLSGGLAGVVGVVVMLRRSATGLFWRIGAAGHDGTDTDGHARRRPELMGAGHGHRLHFHGHSAVHRAPAHLKILALLGFMLSWSSRRRATGTPAFARLGRGPARGRRRSPGSR